MELLTPTIRRTVDQCSRRQMGLPLLLFLCGHRPLLFLAGQVLYVLQPLATLAGLATWGDWAALLSHPRGADLLEDLAIAGLSTHAPWDDDRDSHHGLDSGH